MAGLDAGRVLVVGLGVAGDSVARQLLRRGIAVEVVDDRPSEASRARAAALGLELVTAPTTDELARLVAAADLIVPSPGVAPTHPAFGLARAREVRIWSEFELASRWSDLPLVAVTGTNGKTTVVTLVTDILTASGVRATAAGNTEVPLVDVLDLPLDVIVVEASSFRLEHTETFHPHVAVWLNLAQDHLDWHPSMVAYAAAKARIWANQGSDDVAVVNAEDPVVLEAARSAPSRLVTFGLEGGDYRVAAGQLVGPDDVPIVAVDALWSGHPHDRANALAATAAALHAGATSAGVAVALGRFRGLPHRLARVADADGVAWYDDSKATDPHAALTAVRAFDSVVLIAGGRNKGLDLSVLATEAARLRHVVAIGEAADEVVAALGDLAPLTAASSMDDAVAIAARVARPGDAVVLSPGCASFDWYGSYAERGDDFARAVRDRLGLPEAV